MATGTFSWMRNPLTLLLWILLFGDTSGDAYHLDSACHLKYLRNVSFPQSWSGKRPLYSKWCPYLLLWQRTRGRFGQPQPINANFPWQMPEYRRYPQWRQICLQDWANTFYGSHLERRWHHAQHRENLCYRRYSTTQRCFSSVMHVWLHQLSWSFYSQFG